MTGACAEAARNGHLEVPQILTRRSESALGSAGPRNLAASNGQLHILEYLVERKFDQFDVLACRNAAMDGHLDYFV